MKLLVQLSLGESAAVLPSGRSSPDHAHPPYAPSGQRAAARGIKLEKMGFRANDKTDREVHTMPEPMEPFGRNRWDPLVDIEQPLAIKDTAPATSGESGSELDQPSATSADTSV
jgi:hypothetical protein